MEKYKMIRYGTLALILFFAFEYLWPLLYAPDVQATPTPTPTPGIQNNIEVDTEAKVVKLANRMVLYCNDANATAWLRQKLEQIKGIERLLEGNGVFDATIAQNDTDAAVVEATVAFYEQCSNGIALRKATQMEFGKPITINDTQGKPQTVRLPANLCSQPYWNCLVFATTQENETVKVTVSIKQTAKGEEGFVQQTASAEPAASPTPSPAPSEGSATQPSAQPDNSTSANNTNGTNNT